MKNIRAAGTMLHHFAKALFNFMRITTNPAKYIFITIYEMSSQRALKGFGTIHLGDGFFIIFIEVLKGELARMILELRKRVRLFQSTTQGSL